MRKTIPPLSILLFLLALTLTYAAITGSTIGFVQTNVLSLEENTIILGRDCKAIVAETSPERALSIERAIEGKIEGRPLIHDTFVEVIENFNITLESVKLTRYENEIYYSDIIFTDGYKILEIDTIPSNALALALRVDAPIYINETILNEQGLDICG